jgi:hypothetical protein
MNGEEKMLRQVVRLSFKNKQVLPMQVILRIVELKEQRKLPTLWQPRK